MSRKPATRTEEALFVSVIIFLFGIAVSLTLDNPRWVSAPLGFSVWAIVLCAVALIVQDRKS